MQIYKIYWNKIIFPYLIANINYLAPFGTYFSCLNPKSYSNGNTFYTVHHSTIWYIYSPNPFEINRNYFPQVRDGENKG